MDDSRARKAEDAGLAGAVSEFIESERPAAAADEGPEWFQPHDEDRAPAPPEPAPDADLASALERAAGSDAAHARPPAERAQPSPPPRPPVDAHAALAPAPPRPPARREEEPRSAPAPGQPVESRAVAAPEPHAGERHYHALEVAWILAVFAALGLAFDSEGLLNWARRMEVGANQGRWLSVIAPVHRFLDAGGLTRPRRALAEAASRAGRALGSQEDPLLAGAWRAPDPQDAPAAPAFVPPPPPPIAPEAAKEPTTGAVEPGPPPPASPAPEAPARTTVLLVGDSMMVGNLGAAITKSLSANPRLRVARAFQTGTGLVRADLFDWVEVAGSLLEREKPQIVVCSLGANDGTPIRRDGKVLQFGDRAWDSEYKQRVITMMKTLRSQGARVLWLGLPPMREERFSERADHLNDLFAGAAKKVPGVEFLPVRMLFETGGQFASYSAAAGEGLVRVRMEDGVHYSPAGAKLVAQWIADWTKERLAAKARTH